MKSGVRKSAKNSLPPMGKQQQPRQDQLLDDPDAREVAAAQNAAEVQVLLLRLLLVVRLLAFGLVQSLLQRLEGVARRMAPLALRPAGHDVGPEIDDDAGALGVDARHLGHLGALLGRAELVDAEGVDPDDADALAGARRPQVAERGRAAPGLGHHVPMRAQEHGAAQAGVAVLAAAGVGEGSYSGQALSA